MRRKLQVFILLVSATWMFSSCLSDDTYDYEYPNDTAITAFSLGTVNRIWHTTNSKGEDSVYTTTFTGSNYNFYIDQANRTIYNADSLPVGSDAEHILATISSKNSGTVVLKDTDSDSLIVYSSSDSIDFSVPREIRAYNLSGTAYAAYTVTVNVHKEEADSFRWLTLAQSNAALVSLSRAKAVDVNETIYLFGVDATNALRIYATPVNDGNTWTEVTPSTTLSADSYQSVLAFDGHIYTLANTVSGTNVLRSTDAETWETVATGTSLSRLVGASTHYLYALTPTGISVSKDSGATWTMETLDTDASFLPSAEISFAFTPSKVNTDTENLILMGKRANTYGDRTSVVWNKVLEYANGSENQSWSFVEYDASDENKAPNPQQFLATAYRNGYEALHSDSDSLYISTDGGITWQKDSVAIPTGFDGSHHFTFFKDKQNYLWIISVDGTGNVWKGRHNSEGWRKEETSFTE